MKKIGIFFTALIFLILLEIAKVYFIMPFPGSQRIDSISLAYFIHHNIWWLRVLGIIAVSLPVVSSLSLKKVWQKAVVAILIIFYGVVVYFFNFRFLADKMFYQPKIKIFASANTDTTNRDKLIIGIAGLKKAKAYPVEIIGYHHQIQDSIEQQPILVTYCTVCRTGRIFNPFVNGQFQQFRLVGMDHFNAMFEDTDTKSWWQQATGKAIAGELKGQQLMELPSVQMRLGDWLTLHPESEILQPDSNYKKDYADLKGYDEGTIKGKLEHRDSLSWKEKSWVIGVPIRNKSRAYDWNQLINKKMISDTVNASPVLLTVEKNQKTFYVFNRIVNGAPLDFIPAATEGMMEDVQTHSSWTISGKCISGPLQGAELIRAQAYQEFWHSWKYFHPETTTYQK